MDRPATRCWPTVGHQWRWFILSRSLRLWPLTLGPVLGRSLTYLPTYLVTAAAECRAAWDRVSAPEPICRHHRDVTPSADQLRHVPGDGLMAVYPPPLSLSLFIRDWLVDDSWWTVNNDWHLTSKTSYRLRSTAVKYNTDEDTARGRKLRLNHTKIWHFPNSDYSFYLWHILFVAVFFIN